MNCIESFDNLKFKSIIEFIKFENDFQINGFISIVITIRMTSSLFEAEERINNLCKIIPKKYFEIVIVDYGTSDRYKNKIQNLSSERVKVVTHPAPLPIFSIGAARDYGVQMAKGDAVLFLDIDFLTTENIFKNIYRLAQSEKIFSFTEKFFCIPVFFLTDAGSKQYKINSSVFFESTYEELEDNKELVSFPSYGSSAILINKNYYLSTGGHHKSFKGHGAEDFELLHRLSSKFPLLEKPKNYHKDTKIKGFEPFVGFRPYFARYSLAALSRGIFLIHLYHPKRVEQGYFRRRRNFLILKWLMYKFDIFKAQPEPLVDLSE